MVTFLLCVFALGKIYENARHSQFAPCSDVNHEREKSSKKYVFLDLYTDKKKKIKLY